MRENMSNASSVFFKDMHRLYPDIEQQCQELHHEQSKFFANFLMKGVEEGMFREDLNFVLATKAFIAQSTTIIKEFASSTDPKEMLRMVDTTFVIFLRGIATIKGVSIIDTFLKENQI